MNGKNPHELSVDEQIGRLWHGIETAEECFPWNELPDFDHRHFAKMAPPWPEGRYAFRSVQLRWGYGMEGIVDTFNLHMRILRSVYGTGLEVYEAVRAGRHKNSYTDRDVHRLSLKGRNRTHRQGLKWIQFNLDENMPVAGQELARNASGIDWAARSRFLYQMTRGVADQGLAFLWLHPESVMDTADRKIRGFNMMGYRLNTPDEPDFGERQWNSYPSVFFPRGIVSPATGDYEVEYYPFVSICLDTEGMSAPTVL